MSYNNEAIIKSRIAIQLGLYKEEINMLEAILIIGFLVIVILSIMASTLYVVRQQSVAIIERFGKYQGTATSGIHIRLPFGIDRIAARVQLRLLQSEIIVETKTKDNVFVTLNVATQYRVNEQNVIDAYYKLIKPEAQIRSYIEDALRSSVPKLTLDELFEKKDEIALEVQHQVAEEMSTYGYIIVKTLITKVEPDAEVKQSMNEINAAQRKRVAAQELANADKIKIVTAAEAEAEKDRLHGVGIAQQRKAIVDGLADSIQELKEANISLNEEQIMSILLTNQYLDTLNTFAAKGNQTLFLPNTPNGVDDIRTQVLSALKTR
ncbi:putative stomatin/prohibitin-family membrane protease subunit [Streptococcus equi subsp. zooepidemicus ATCC 35246]|nr:putative stomatin/prohibitin-family membrane protease subunit [Streptococcus equi subsp. zooepidemicus ATCC 35246]